ncbi:MAG: chromosome segregation protein SMC, partial [Clostridia bacterium]|nr:chromosome segregation protein SMC [Clostridia bacterium]
MLLRSIQIQGFKSFADKTVLKFGKGITAVVGPNGSGKSNISDAVRWVLGEQSTKSLRGQSMEDVIFGGTETRRPHGFCEVTLNIDNSDRTLNFDNDSVSITRRYYRSHESEYAINNVSVRLKDIHELFMDTGLGRDGYSMIGQGKIDHIVSSKSGERRDIFEEAAGISKYRYRKLEAERKLQAAEDNLLRLHDIADELESRVGPLKEQSRKAERFLELADSKKELEIGLWLHTLQNSKELLRAQESKIAAAQLTYQEIDNALRDFDRKTEENTAYFAQLTSQIEGERLVISNLNAEILKTESAMAVIENDIAHHTQQIERLQKELAELGKSDEEATAEIENRKAEIAVKTAEKETAGQTLAGLEEKLACLLTDSEGISRQIETEIRALNALTAAMADKRVEMVAADSAVEDILARADSAKEDIAQFTGEIVRLNDEFSKTGELVKKMEEDILARKNAIKGYEMRLASREGAVKTKKTEAENMRLDLEAKRRRVQILRDLENNMEGFSHSVKKIMEESSKGTLRGICGAVSKLIHVESRYSVAIETALAAAIQNVVVETEADAKRAIQFLKANKAGRATFLPVATIKAREWKDQDLSDCPGFVGIAADLVQTDPKYRETVKYLLGGTVVAEDLDAAAAIAKRAGYRLKVVSLDGQVINPGGSLTGGSLVKSAGLLGRSGEINRLEEENKALSAAYQEKEKQLLLAQEEAAKVRADITAQNAELITANEDLIRALAELKRIEDLRTNAETALRRLEEERTDGEAKLASFRETSAAAAKEIAQTEAKKQEIQARIDQMTGGRDDLNTERETAANDITALKLSMMEIQKDIEAITASVAHLEEAIGGRSEHAQSVEREIAQYRLKIEELQQNSDASASGIEVFRQKIAACEQTIEQLIEKRNQTEKDGLALRASERGETDRREKISGELARLTERKEVMIAEYDNVIRQLYDEYQITRSDAEAIGKPVE